MFSSVSLNVCANNLYVSACKWIITVREREGGGEREREREREREGERELSLIHISEPTRLA